MEEEYFFKVNNFGVISVDTPNIKNYIQQLYKNALGQELNLEDSTPQGQLIINDTVLLEQIQKDLLVLVNNFNIKTATAQALDNVAEVFGYYRQTQTATLVFCTLQGISGTVIPKNSKAQDQKGYIYETIAEYTINEEGICEAQLMCTTLGSVYCAPNSLTIIIDSIEGWNSINNSLAGITGMEEESDDSFRRRILENQLLIRARTPMQSIIANIKTIPNVVDCVGNENDADVQRTVDGIIMPRHSIYLSVLGGENEKIAESLAFNKTLGATTIGDTLIEYEIQRYYIYRPKLVNIKLGVFYIPNIFTESNLEQLIKERIITYIASHPFRLKENLTSNFLDNIFNGFEFCDIVDVQLKRENEENYTNMIQFGPLEYPVVNENDIEVILWTN